MLTAYIDDSKTEHALVLGGYAATPARWENFSDSWQMALSARPAISGFKAAHAARLEGEFQGMSATARDEKVRELCSIIDAHAEVGFSAIVELTEFTQTMNELNVPKRLRNPYFYAFSQLVRALTFNLKNLSHEGDIINFVFDDQAIEKTRVIRGWEQFKSAIPEPDRSILVSYPSFKDDNLVLPLQAADLAARTGQQWVSEKLGRPVKGILPPYQWSPKNGLQVYMSSEDIRTDYRSFVAEAAREAN